MATFTCWCGHVIHEDQEPTSVACMVVTERDRLPEEVAEGVLSFVAADARGAGAEWVKTAFLPGYPVYPQDITAKEVVSDLLLVMINKLSVPAYHCPQCGRLYLMVKGSDNQWESWLPEHRISGFS